MKVKCENSTPWCTTRRESARLETGQARIDTPMPMASGGVFRTRSAWEPKTLLLCQHIAEFGSDAGDSRGRAPRRARLRAIDVLDGRRVAAWSTRRGARTRRVPCDPVAAYTSVMIPLLGGVSYCRCE